MSEFELNLSYASPAHKDVFYGHNERFIVVRKGRRAGFTRGLANASCRWLAEGQHPLLWVDTVNANIDRYFDRYFRPILRGIPNRYWNWSQQKRIFTLMDSYMDFRSSDRPENIEGFGYKKIILNEAGIILEDDYLYENAILPMMADFTDSQLFAIGKPMGKVKKNGSVHKFYELWQRAESGTPGYWGKGFSSYDNLKLSKENLQAIENEISPAEVPQEIYGEFTEASGTNPFAHQYSIERHEDATGKVAILSKDRPLIISIDFNINPFAVSFHHKWTDQKGPHHHVVHEKSIDNGNIEAMANYINQNFGYWLPACEVTGDASGNRRSIEQADLASIFTQLQRKLNLRHKQIQVPPNPFHVKSRNDCNYFLLHFPDFKINRITCPETSNDCRRVQWDSKKEQILKQDRKDATQRADFLDTLRAVVNTYYTPWINLHSKRVA